MTFSDWTYTNGDPSLDDSTYVSSPSCIRFKSFVAHQYLYAISKKAEVQSIINGQVITNFRFNSVQSNAYAMPNIYFRFQDTNNFYVINFDNRTGLLKIQFNQCVAGTNTTIDTRSWTFTPLVNTWYKFRITFWEVASILYVRIEYWSGSAWVKQGADMDDQTPVFTSGGKMGIGAIIGSDLSNYVWHDDTELWG